MFTSRLAHVAGLALAGCGGGENHPVYTALKANPPTSIPGHHLARVKSGLPACDVHNEGTANQSMTVWWPSGRPFSLGHLTFYGGGLARPVPTRTPTPGGKPITTVRIE